MKTETSPTSATPEAPFSDNMRTGSPFGQMGGRFLFKTIGMWREEFGGETSTQTISPDEDFTHEVITLNEQPEVREHQYA